ncbi:hypothetical protein MBLNU230_g2365t1 [Neophaeotheca triangularis]
MAGPLIPAAASTLAYLNARYGLTHDLGLIKNSIVLNYKAGKLEKADRVNVFYRIEELAQSPQTAKNLFLVLPPDETKPKQQTQWTYAEAYEQILKHATWLKEKHGVRKNEVVALDCTNKPVFLWLWFALWSLGAMPAFINTNLRGKGFVHCVRISTARIVLLDEEIAGEIMDEQTKLELEPTGTGRAVDAVILDSTAADEVRSQSPYRAPDDVRSGAKLSGAAQLIYTSGTTGLPKAANVSWGKGLIGGAYVARFLSLKPEDRFFTAMPLYHSSASVLGATSVVAAGCTLVLGAKFSPRKFMRQASQTDATIVQYVGEMCRYLLAAPPTPYDRQHKVRAAFGNGMRPDVWQGFKDRFGVPTVGEFYGATEGPGAHFNLSNNSFSRGAIGRAGPIIRLLMGNQSALVKYDTETDEPARDARTNFCTKADTNEPGEAIYKLDPAQIEEKFQGYFGNEKATSSKVMSNVFEKGDAWYRTGDLLRRDGDGRWWFVDRIGDTFRWKGENVSTNEVSEALGSHPAVREANVYGVQLPGHDGRAGCAALLLNSEATTLDEGLAAELAKHVRQRLPKYAVPLFLRMPKAFEMTGTMKQTKVALRNGGVEPSKMGEDEVFWLPPANDRYVRLGEKDWQAMTGGQVKL